MKPRSDDMDDRLRDAYRALPQPAAPDLEPALMARIREARKVRAPQAAGSGAPVGSGARWLLRLYWLATAVVTAWLLGRFGASQPGVATLALGAAAVAPLVLAVRAICRSAGVTAARLVAGATGA